MKCQYCHQSGRHEKNCRSYRGESITETDIIEELAKRFDVSADVNDAEAIEDRQKAVFLRSLSTTIKDLREKISKMEDEWYSPEHMDKVEERTIKPLREKAGDAEYYKWRLAEILPLFQEARDALTAIPLTVARLRNLDLNLADRMDAAGTRNKEQFNIQKRLGKEG
jgi:hypothetical protein